MAREVGFAVTVIDARSIFATPERFDNAAEVIRAWPDDALDRVTLDAYSFVVVLSHDEKFDLPTVERALRSRVPYIGAMGSRATHERRLAKLQALGFGETDLARVRTPIGLDLGARTPEEIALAVLAEVVAVRHGRSGTPLSAAAEAALGAG